MPGMPGISLSKAPEVLQAGRFWNPRWVESWGEQRLTWWSALSPVGPLLASPWGPLF